jgi:hypothetical protein
MGGYYVTVRDERGRTMFALGPFRRHQRAKGLVRAVRLRVSDAGLDPFHALGYGTSRVRGGHRPLGAFNRALHVGADDRHTIPAQALPAAVLTRLQEA